MASSSNKERDYGSTCCEGMETRIRHESLMHGSVPFSTYVEDIENVQGEVGAGGGGGGSGRRQ